MVKGTNKRVIVVKSPDPKIFEQAIFIVKEDYRKKDGANAADVLREAQRVADDYVRASVYGKRRRLRLPLPLVIGAAVGLAGLVWLLLALVGA